MKRSKATKRSRKAAKKKCIKPDDKEAANTFVPAAIPKVVENPAPATPGPVESPLLASPEPKPVSSGPDQPKPIASPSRSEAARRTAEGKFTKASFAQIGGTECPRFAAMTWKERDKFMAKPENSVVRERYETHMASLGK
jgi:hypothetical protein